MSLLPHTQEDPSLEHLPPGSLGGLWGTLPEFTLNFMEPFPAPGSQDRN